MRTAKLKRLHIGLAIALVALLGITAYLYRGYAEAKREIKEMQRNPQTILHDKTEDLLAEVGELMVLPEDETPTVATVSDLEKLQGQEFFANAKVGNKVLIYTKHKKAILYDPELKKIVEVAPLNLGASNAASDTTP
jgi:hypothetical protein